MKRFVAYLILVMLWATSALAVNYAPIVFDSAGLNLNEQSMNAPANTSVKLDNFYTGIDRSSTLRLGAISKTLGRGAYLSTMPISGKSRGIFSFPLFSFTSYYALIDLVSTPDLMGSVYYQGSGTWTQFAENTGSSTIEISPGVPTISYPFSFSYYNDTFRGLNTVYFCNGYSFKKWFRSVASFEVLSDVQDTGVTNSLSGTVYFTNSDQLVTGSATSFLSEGVKKGTWIKKDASSLFYEVESCTSETALTLRNLYTDVSTSSASVRFTSPATIYPTFLTIWKSRLWTFEEGNSSMAGKLRCSATISSSTPAALEVWTGSDTGYTFVPGEGPYGTALNFTDDYLFAFKDTNYSVYQYDSSVVPPIALVKTWNYGCPANNTVAQVDNGLIYYTGNDVRFTTGFSDASIAGSIKNYLTYAVPGASMKYYYGLTSGDNGYPYAIYDEVNKLYHLYLPAYGVELTYDWTKQLWVGQDKFNNVGAATKVYSTLTSTMNQIVYHPVSGGNQLYSINANAGTSATGEIQSADLMLGDAKQMKRVNWVEFWVHPSGTTETTLAFNYYVDGKQGLTTPLYASVYDSTGGNNTYQKVRFPVNTNAQYFRWDLQDISALKHGSSEAQSYPGQISLVGGNIAYDYIQGN